MQTVRPCTATQDDEQNSKYRHKLPDMHRSCSLSSAVESVSVHVSSGRDYATDVIKSMFSSDQSSWVMYGGSGWLARLSASLALAMWCSSSFPPLSHRPTCGMPTPDGVLSKYRANMRASCRHADQERMYSSRSTGAGECKGAGRNLVCFRCLGRLCTHLQ